MDEAPAPIPRDTSIAEPSRCPACGSGLLLTISVFRRDRGVWRAACCAGLYDRRRRQVVRRSCGWSGDADPDAVAPPAAGPARRGDDQRDSEPLGPAAAERAAANSSPGFQRGIVPASETR